MDEVFHLADRITVLRDGRLVKTLDRAATRPQEVTHLMVGREIEAVDFGASGRRARCCCGSKICRCRGPGMLAAGG